MLCWEFFFSEILWEKDFSFSYCIGKSLKWWTDGPVYPESGSTGTAAEMWWNHTIINRCCQCSWFRTTNGFSFLSYRHGLSTFQKKIKINSRLFFSKIKRLKVVIIIILSSHFLSVQIQLRKLSGYFFYFFSADGDIKFFTTFSRTSGSPQTVWKPKFVSDFC